MKGEWSALVSELAVVAAVALSHMSMPNHWLPYALVGVGQKWTLRKTLFITFLGALGHVLSTLAVIAALSGLGGALLSHGAYRQLSSSFLLCAGLYYLFTYVVRRRRDSCCGDGDGGAKAALAAPPPSASAKGGGPGAGDGAAAAALVAVTALSPCVGSMPVLLAVLAPPLDAARVLLAGATLLLASSAAMLGPVALSVAGAARVDLARVRRHERLVLGLSLVLLAALTFFVLSRHGGHGGHAQHAPHAHAAGAMGGEVVRQGGGDILRQRKRGCH